MSYQIKAQCLAPIYTKRQQSLMALVWTTPYQAISTIYGISDIGSSKRTDGRVQEDEHVNDALAWYVKRYPRVRFRAVEIETITCETVLYETEPTSAEQTAKPEAEQ